MVRSRAVLAAFALVTTLGATAAFAVPGKIVIRNLDSAGEGFNAPAAAAPVGGNPGTTVGQQRLNVFQHAANIWGAILQNTDTIYVNSNFDSLTCTPTSAVLGSAGPKYIDRDETGFPFTGTWYHIALGNQLFGSRIVDRTQFEMGEITARFNSELDGAPTCLGGNTWYYGYDGNEGGQVELLPVVLHELGHGLGFSSTTNGQTGAFNSGFPGVFDQFLYDSLTARTWANVSETAGQRATSALSGDKLAWNGAAGKYGVTHYPLAHRARVLVNVPAIAMAELVNAASFGQALTVGGVTANLVLVTDAVAPTNDGCTALTNAASVAGKVALVDRGVCNFTVKAQTAQAAGAVAVIIANNVAGPLAPSGVDPTITIPVVGISLADGNTLKTALGSGTVNVTVGLHPVLYAGADGSNRPLMYAPNPYQAGSSVSHFDVSMTPNALMEPAINNDLSSAVDLTTHVFVDIGWLPMTTPTALATFTAEDIEEGILLAWRFADDSDISTLTLQRATSEAGPWTAVETELFTRDGMTAACEQFRRAGSGLLLAPERRGTRRARVQLGHGDGVPLRHRRGPRGPVRAEPQSHAHRDDHVVPPAETGVRAARHRGRERAARAIAAGRHAGRRRAPALVGRHGGRAARCPGPLLRHAAHLEGAAHAADRRDSVASVAASGEPEAAVPRGRPLRRYACERFSIRAQASLSVTVRLKTGAPGFESGSG